MLSIKCNTGLFLTECPFGAKCNKVLGLCQCKSEYPINLSEHIPCLNFRKLGEQCIHSSQCGKTSNAVCYDTNFNELKKIAKIDDDYKYGIENYGECKCKVCQILFLDNLVFQERYILF